MKTSKRIVCWIVGVFLATFFAILWLPWNFIWGGNHSEEFKYNNVLSLVNDKNANLQNTPVTRIALLGSHDALTSEINAGSMVDTAREGNPANTWYSQFAKGLVARWSKAQQHDIITQLNAGVRYVDIRVSYIKGVYYNAHGLVSGKFETSIKQMLKFLGNNPGEFLVLHFVYAYLGDTTYDDMANFIASVKYENRNLFDYVNYDKTTTNASTITYGIATNNATKGGVVILSDENGHMTGEYADYFKINKSYGHWKNKIETDTLIKMVDEEYESLLNNPSKFEGCFSINQLQTTPNYDSIFNSVFTWSLTNKAQFHNEKLINYENFDRWLTVMPIVMVDFTTSKYGNFNQIVNEKIMAYNKAL